IALTKKKLKAAWEEQKSVYGDFEEIESVSRSKYQTYEIVVVKASFIKDGKTAYLDIKITYDAKKKVAGLFFIPSSGPKDYESVSYVDRSKFTEEEIVFGDQAWALPGYLTIPKVEGPFPAVILVHGSGPNDRDETLGPNKPFKDIAWGLSSSGIAVLRYDKRTMVYSEKVIENIHDFTVNEETIFDVISAVEFLAGDDRIDSNRIYVLGHSLGGMMIPKIASLTKHPAGFIIMAGTIRKLEDLTLEQVEHIAAADGKVDAKEEKNINEIKKMIEKIKEIQKGKRMENPELILGASNKYWIDFDEYDICRTAKMIKKPVFIIQGERDYQVTMKDLELWKECLTGLNNFTFKSYPALNHIFIAGDGICVPEEYFKPGHIAPEVIQDLINWINTNSGK
ncbi:MAG TPA: DUF3887 domain-containing protein, partial [Firmicutes bacterium]|nr:DUF3887 domain-containing protein [Bacillota bacterium]